MGGITRIRRPPVISGRDELMNDGTTHAATTRRSANASRKQEREKTKSASGSRKRESGRRKRSNGCKNCTTTGVKTSMKTAMTGPRRNSRNWWEKHRSNI